VCRSLYGSPVSEARIAAEDGALSNRRTQEPPATRVSKPEIQLSHAMRSCSSIGVEIPVTHLRSVALIRLEQRYHA
jgi:hypothetical protein